MIAGAEAVASFGGELWFPQILIMCGVLQPPE